MNKVLLIVFCCITTLCDACQNEEIEYGKGDIKISIEAGEEWKHNFPLFMGITIKNSPQIAIWVEDTVGNYISTIYVTRRIATQSWRSAKGNRRKETLPHWSYSRGVQYEDGLYLPTKKQPFVDGISGATPKGSFEVRLQSLEEMKRFVVKLEINHSTDFNEYYPKTATEGENNYSGGKEGSGQPALIYSAEIDLTGDKKTFDAILIGHSSPDGSDGRIYKDLSGITSALYIVRSIVVTIPQE